MTNKPDINIKETASKILESKGKLSENQYFKKLEAFVSTLSKEPVSDSGFPFNLDAAKILFQGIGLGIAIIDNEFKIAFCNPSMAKALCKTLENIEGEKCYEVFQCKDDVCHFCPAKKASQTGKTKDVEVIVNCEDNEGQWLRILSIPLIENKKVYGFLDVVHNISEKKATEMQLTREKEYIKLIAETSPAGIVHLSKQGEIKYANQMAEKILGLTKNEILIRKYNSPEWEITDFEGNPFPDKELPFEQVKEKMKPVNDIRHTIKVGKDNWRYLSVNASPVINENGKFNGMVASLDDISDKIKVAKKLEEENHFRKAIIQNAAEGLCVCKEIPDFPYVKFTHWNDRMTGITGYSMDEINEKGWYQSLYPDPYIQQKAIERMAKMREGEDIIREEWEIAAKSGEKRIITISSTILKLKGDATHVMALIEDVTDHRNAMQALLESEEKYKQLFEYSPNSVTYSDINGNIIDCNLTILEAHKYRSKEEVIGRNVMEFIAPEYLEKAKTNFEKLIRNEKREDSKYRFLKSDGTTFPVELSAKIVKDFQGKPVGIISISQDLTEKNIAKEQLQQAADIFNHIPSGIFIYHLEDINDDTTLKMVAVNSAAAKLIGVKCGDMLEKTLDQNFPYLREKHIPQQYAQVIRQQKPIEIEDIYYKDDRVDGAFEVWVFPLPGNKVGVAFNNITEKKTITLT